MTHEKKCDRDLHSYNAVPLMEQYSDNERTRVQATDHLSGIHLGGDACRSQEERPTIPALLTNADNDYLGDDCWVDEVNGPGAAEVPDFVPTRHELFQLLKYWHEVSEGNNYVFFRTGMMRADSETRLDFFAESRMSRIERLLGDKEARKAINESYEEFGKKQDQRTWDIYHSGNEEQKRAFHEEQERAFYEEQERALSGQTATDCA